jgi:mycofactocin precursor
MDDTATIDAAANTSAPHDADSELIDDELLVEEISIDGMCGVY